jgi:hypothetical protein
MGGLGSGRPSGSGRDKVEACRSIDINRLHKTGCLIAGWSGGWQWTRDGEKVAWIDLRAEADRLHLAYRVRIAGGEWQDVEESVCIVRVPCRLGGARSYFICPGLVNGVACGRRVAKLHGPGRYFLCRHCYRLAHASQSERGWDRALRRANKIRHRLGGDPGMAVRLSQRSRRACGGGPTSGCASKSLRRKCSLMKPLRSRPIGCWRGSTTRNERGHLGDDPDQTGPVGRDRRHRGHPLQRATPWHVIALHRAALGGCGRVPRPRRGARGRARTAGTDRGAPSRGTGRHPLAQAPPTTGRGSCSPARAGRHARLLSRDGEGGAGAPRRCRPVRERRRCNPRHSDRY